MEQPIIRKALASDINQMLKLLESLFSIETDFVFDADKQRAGIKEMLDQDDRGCGCIYVAELNNEILGMCSIQKVISTAEGGPSGLVEDMVVKKMWQKKGLGKKLLNAICSWAENNGIRRIQLLADRQNSQALTFYQKQGWQTTQLICLRSYTDLL